jgi:hypothetical protein
MLSMLPGVMAAILIGTGQFPIQDPPQAVDSQLSARVQQLEAETAALRAELNARQGQVAPVAQVAQPSAAIAADPLTSEQAVAAPPISMDTFRAEMRKLAWTKGDYTIVPYGTLWATGTYETAQTYPGDYVMYVQNTDQSDESRFYCDGRSTRLGIDVTGPRIPGLGCAVTGGKVEIDFQRNIDIENRASVLLRHAYVEAKNDEFRLLAGQTWDVMSPLFPGMLMYSVGWGGGNIGFRRAQIRGERYYEISECNLLTFQAAIARDTGNIFDSTSGATFEPAPWPVVEGRVATTLGPRGKDCTPWEFGMSGHIGETIYDFSSTTWGANAADDVHSKTWSANGDFRMPLTRRFGVQGEIFIGENLGTYYGGILQSIDIGTPANPGSREGIRSAGGWVDFWYDLTPRLHTHWGYSIDDPFNEDLTTGRTYNQFFFSNISYDVTKKFLVGYEIMQWKTNWVGRSSCDSVNMSVVAKYGF